LPLGLAHFYLFERTDDASTLDAAIEHLAVAVPAQTDDEYRLALTLDLAGLLLTRYDRASGDAADLDAADLDAADLDAAIELLRAAADALEPGELTRTLAVWLLVDAVSARAGDDVSPHETVELAGYLRELVSHIPHDDPERPVMLVRLAMALAQRVSGLRQWTPELDPMLPMLIDTLPALLFIRALRVLDRADAGTVDGLIDEFAVTRTSDFGDVFHALMCSLHDALLADRARRTGRANDVDDALDMLSDRPRGHAARAPSAGLPQEADGSDAHPARCAEELCGGRRRCGGYTV
jgi:hypothetical protein